MSCNCGGEGVDKVVAAVAWPTAEAPSIPSCCALPARNGLLERDPKAVLWLLSEEEGSARFLSCRSTFIKDCGSVAPPPPTLEVFGSDAIANIMRRRTTKRFQFRYSSILGILPRREDVGESWVSGTSVGVGDVG